MPNIDPINPEILKFLEIKIFGHLLVSRQGLIAEVGDVFG